MFVYQQQSSPLPPQYVFLASTIPGQELDILPSALPSILPFLFRPQKNTFLQNRQLNKILEKGGKKILLDVSLLIILYLGHFF